MCLGGSPKNCSGKPTDKEGKECQNQFGGLFNIKDRGQIDAKETPELAFPEITEDGWLCLNPKKR